MKPWNQHTLVKRTVIKARGLLTKSRHPFLGTATLYADLSALIQEAIKGGFVGLTSWAIAKKLAKSLCTNRTIHFLIGNGVAKLPAIPLPISEGIAKHGQEDRSLLTQLDQLGANVGAVEANIACASS